jgi:hypothetical protein
MNGPRVLLVEDNELWQTILQTHIGLALPDSDPPFVVGTFQDGDRALRQGGWDLVVTDIGLPPDSGHILGMQLVSLAQEVGVPCIVVSDTQSVTKQLVRDLLVGKNYRARDYFGKDELRKSPDIQRRFHDLIREIVSRERDRPEGEADRGASPAAPSSAPPRGATAGREADAAPAPLRVSVGIRDGSFYLSSEGRANLPIPRGPAEKVFIFFARNVSAGLPAKVVENRILNASLGAKAEDTADQGLRKTIKQLNDRLRDWAALSEGRRWIVKGLGEHGYHLNATDVHWDLTRELRDEMRGDETKLFYLLTDPRTLQENTPNRDERLPARPVRPKRPSEDEDDDG